MRFAVLGAGAIGGAIGGGLHRAGHEVTLIARGAQLEALRRDGLTLQTPDEDFVLDVPVAGSPAQAGPADAVILAVKSQDTVGALNELGASHPDAAIVCAQNGIANEGAALRRFARVYGMYVYLTAQYLTPGVVQVYCHPVAGLLDLGRYPYGVDETARAVAGALSEAGFASRPVADIMRMKRSKLLGNLVNAIQIVCGDGGDEVEELHARARDEAEACYAAAGVDWAPWAEIRERGAEVSPPRAVHGEEHRYSSSWQSLQRGTGRIETDHLNGEIVLLGRLHGVPTPVNAEVQRLANRIARDGGEPDPAAAAALLG